MDLRRALRLIVITDPRLPERHGRTVETVVEAALAAGARAIQLRDKGAPARILLDRARRLRALTREAGALLFVNDRLDVALAAGADGVHLGPDDLPLAAVREAAGDALLVGYSTDDPERARRAREEGAAYLGCGDVFGTGSKADAGAVIGLERLDEVARAVAIPVVAIGGVTPERAADVARTAAAGTAVIGAVMGAADPGGAVRALLSPFQDRDG
ncbi:MAG: thiamine phosphate synthase [Gemmatimonadetes bacterium]|nr:thiamine phosphate synthase [Gemmatimonadota bacterium]